MISTRDTFVNRDATEEVIWTVQCGCKYVAMADGTANFSSYQQESVSCHVAFTTLCGTADDHFYSPVDAADAFSHLPATTGWDAGELTGFYPIACYAVVHGSWGHS